MAKVAIAAAFLMTVAYALYVATPSIKAFAADMVAFGALAVRACLGTGVFAVGVVGVWWLRRQSDNRNRQQDGAFALREYHLEPWTKRAINTLTGKPSPIAVYDHNTNGSHAAVIAGGVWTVEPGWGWEKQLAYLQDIERTRRVEAAIAGDAVLGNPFVNLQRGLGGVANAATGRLLAGAYDKPIKPPPATIEQPQAQIAMQPANVTLGDAMRRTEEQSWPLGYAEDGTLATFNPLWHSHAAIVGSPGTGKTTSVGYLLAAHALRQGWHVVILDADNGVAWSPFVQWAEHAETDTDAFPAQVDVLTQELNRRMGIMKDAGVTDISGMSGIRRMLIVIEEYGDLIATLRMRSRAAADEIDTKVDTLLRRGRKAGMHFGLIDQYPENWSNQIIAGTKFRAVFQLGPNQGAKVEEYKAGELPARGVFLNRGKRYTAWHAQPPLRQLLAEVPAMSVPTRILGGATFARSVDTWEGGATSGSERPNAYTEQPAPNVVDVGPTDLQAAVWEWRDKHPNGTQAELRRDFEARNIRIARGYASDLWHKWTPKQAGNPNRIDLSTAAGRVMFAQYAQDARLPSGDKFGVDITGGAA